MVSRDASASKNDYIMKLRSSDLQSDSDMDSTRNSCDVLIDASFPNAHFAFPKLFANCVAK